MGLVVKRERKKRREGRRLPIVDPLDAPSDTTPWDGRRAYSLCQAYMDTVIKDGDESYGNWWYTTREGRGISIVARMFGTAILPFEPIVDAAEMEILKKNGNINCKATLSD